MLPPWQGGLFKVERDIGYYVEVREGVDSPSADCSQTHVKRIANSHSSSMVKGAKMRTLTRKFRWSQKDERFTEFRLSLLMGVKLFPVSRRLNTAPDWLVVNRRSALITLRMLLICLGTWFTIKPDLIFVPRQKKKYEWRKLIQIPLNPQSGKSCLRRRCLKIGLIRNNLTFNFKDIFSPPQMSIGASTGVLHRSQMWNTLHK